MGRKMMLVVLGELQKQLETVELMAVPRFQGLC